MIPVRLRLPAVMLACLVFASITHAQTAAELTAQGLSAYTAKHYADSASRFRKALSASTDSSERASIGYNLACDEALQAHTDAAFAALDHAVEDGYGDLDHLQSDTDLASLHADSRWPALLAEIKATAAAQDLRWGSAAFKTPFVPALSETEKLAGLSELWAQAKYGFANFWHVPTLNWDKTYLDFIPQVIATNSTADYYRVLESFYAQLQDGHSGVYPPDQIAYGRIPISTALIDGHVLILGARNGSDIQNLQPGDEILSINGQPVTAYAAGNVLPYVTTSSPQDRDSRTYTRQLLSGPVGTTFTLQVATPSGQRSTHVFTVAPWKYQPSQLFSFRMLPGNIAYVALNGFDDDTAAKEWDKDWPEISHAASLIIDMRENGGGDDSVGAHILATLLEKPVPAPSQESTRWIATYRAWGQPQMPLQLPSDSLGPDPTHHFAGKVVMLTSPRTYSAGEDMVVLFTAAHRGQIFGESTGGSTGQPLMFSLPGGGTARICTKHDRFPDGHEFVGVGVPPDVPIHNTRADIVAGRDRVLEAATKALTQTN